jgi:glycosyltransferase involved in cell wall biosynthesis
MPDEKNNPSSIKAAYLHGRPSAHPLHQKLAKLFDADFYLVDAFIRWQDKNIPAPFLPFIWLLCGLFQKNAKKYNLFLVDNLHVSVVFMKYLRLNKKKQKIVVHLGSHTLFFIRERKFSGINLFFQKWALKRYDAIICEGKMAMDYVNEILPGKKPQVYYSFNGLAESRVAQLKGISPNLSSKNILTITQISGASFRLWYKGIDVMLEAFALAHSKDPELKFIIVGEVDEQLLSQYTSRLPAAALNNIVFAGYSKDLFSYYAGSSLYLHTARGDAFPTTTLEALMVGIPTLISDQTGTKEIVLNVSDSLVTALDAPVIAGKINDYFQLSPAERTALSEKCKTAVVGYTEERSFANYRQIMNEVVPG